MTIRDILAHADIPSLEAEVILSHLLGEDRVWLLAHSEHAVDAGIIDAFQRDIEIRRTGMPVAYITGEREFYGRTFIVRPSVLIPRPSTEALVEAAHTFLTDPKDSIVHADTGIVILSRSFRSGKPKVIVDVGTGSGCIAIILALEYPDYRVIATDISPDALDVAQENARRHSVAHRIEWREGDLLQSVCDLHESFLVVSNPPYIPEGRALQRETTFEPRAALVGGRIPQILMLQASDNPYCCGAIIECEESQAAVMLDRR